MTADGPAAVVRRATPDDAPAIAAIEASAAHQPWTEPQLRLSLQAPTTWGWVALEPGGTLAGHLLACCVAEEGEILTVAVAPGARRRGLGRQLMGVCIRHWREVGATTGWLEVRQDNVAALRLYDATGWTRAGERRRYYRDGADAQVMRWSGGDP